MENRNDSTHNGKDERGIFIHGRPVPFQSGVLPTDFPKRLARLREASGLTWNAFADAAGVDRKQMQRWYRKGMEPCGGAMLSIVRIAFMIPGGIAILFGEGFQMFLWQE